MTPLETAISLCGSQAELARRIGGKTKTGHIYYWLANGLSEDVAPLIEVAVDGRVTCEQLCPQVKWTRDRKGVVTGYHVPLPKSEAA